MIEKILRAPLPDQLKALLEKLDSDPDASSIQRVNHFVRNYAAYLTRYERMMFRRSIRRINRELLMNEAMSVVINTPENHSWEYPSTLTIEQVQRDTMQILNKEFLKGYAESSLGRANVGLYAAQAKAKVARVNY